MNAPPARLLVLVGEQFACVKVIGRATFAASLDFKTLLNELCQKGYLFFVLDLSACSLMDSTFLGVLAGLGLKMSLEQKEQGCRLIELYKPNPRITELLESLGVIHLFRITSESPVLPQSTAEHEPLPCNYSKEELTRASLEAHQTLMGMNPGNVARFKDVARFLAEDLRRLKSVS
jgi:anti-anti-sigma regulatory factor